MAGNDVGLPSTQSSFKQLSKDVLFLYLTDDSEAEKFASVMDRKLKEINVTCYIPDRDSIAGMCQLQQFEELLASCAIIVCLFTKASIRRPCTDDDNYFDWKMLSLKTQTAYIQCMGDKFIPVSLGIPKKKMIMFRAVHIPMFPSNWEEEFSKPYDSWEDNVKHAFNSLVKNGIQQRLLQAYHTGEKLTFIVLKSGVLGLSSFGKTAESLVKAPNGQGILGF